MFGGVSIREEKKLRIAVEGDVRVELVRYRSYVLRKSLRLDVGEGSASGVSLGARVAACSTL